MRHATKLTRAENIIEATRVTSPHHRIASRRLEVRHKIPTPPALGPRPQATRCSTRNRATLGLSSDEKRAFAAFLAPRYEHSSDQTGARFPRKAAMPSCAWGIRMLATMTALASS
jgi:hypothetical protein